MCKKIIPTTISKTNMRKFYYLILLLCSMHQIYGQQTFVGSYKVDIAKSLSLMEGEIKQKYEGLDSAVKERAKESMKDRVFNFKEEGQVEVRWNVNGSERVADGSWEFKSDDILTIKIGEQVTEYSVSKPTENDLVLKNQNGKGLFGNLYLTRN